ncbi:methyltransferase domain-containing protein [Alloacidobacterium dinghuense]|uniref:Methyltransferase domain-containing protein n=1 Tax=Alloacidobacterium dinghuense TaxID=2763107 RepID=A0A7G8BI57_9BACT|nr:class I SAM-dependent methyltransferase [Alloacidobacterium dinghuense]QNI32227.1 methyltransferase domain-containing protein [Alloacidobacterium dinghuense]
MSRQLNFDRLARPYRWLEYSTFGRSLERCRFHFLPSFTSARRALVLGDGDGRFLARLLHSNPQIEADVVDISPAMLRLLRERLTPEARRRITLHEADARGFTPAKSGYDLVVTHFFFDCLFQPDLEALVDRITPRLAANASWVVSEFARSSGETASVAGRAVISSLYAAFGLLTGLEVRSLPDQQTALEGCGFQLCSEKQWLRGLLISQLWQR